MVKLNEIQKVEIDSVLLEKSRARESIIREKIRSGKLNELTYRDSGSGIILGCMSELIFEQQLTAYGIKEDFWKWENKTEFDYTVDRFKIEVKSKDRTAKPELNFACTVSDYNKKHQDADFYYFVSFLKKDKRSDTIPFAAYLVGATTKTFIERNAVFRKKGEVDDKMVIKFDCHNIKVSDTIANKGFFTKILGGKIS